MSHLQKAKGFQRDRNWMQTLRYSDLALVKLKKLNDRPIEEIDDALRCKFSALNLMGRNRDALECAKERYCMYLTCHTHPPAIDASFYLIESCIHNKEYEDAELYARTTWETITLSNDSHIPDNQREYFTATGAYYLAKAMLHLAQSLDIPPEANRTAGQEAIGLAGRALEINTQLHGTEDQNVAGAMRLLADALNYFNNVDDVEVLRLFEQSNAITARVEGSSSTNVGAGKTNLAMMYQNKADRARAVNDVDREMANLELALPLLVDAARIFRAANRVDRIDDAEKGVIQVEDRLRMITIARSGLIAPVAATSATATTG